MAPVLAFDRPCRQDTHRDHSGSAARYLFRTQSRKSNTIADRVKTNGSRSNPSVQIAFAEYFFTILSTKSGVSRFYW